MITTITLDKSDILKAIKLYLHENRNINPTEVIQVKYIENTIVNKEFTTDFKIEVYHKA